MAYNVLKGAVEGSVDQHADQEIGGVKVFKNTISASVFYDTDAQSPCATLKDVALSTIDGTPDNTLLVYTANQTAKTTHTLAFREQTLIAPAVKAGSFAGSGAGLYNLPIDKFDGVIPAQHIDHGPGIHNIRGSLQLKSGPGLQVDDEGIGVAIDLKSGLKVRHNYLTIDPSRAPDIKKDGQNLSDADLLLVGDISRGTLHNSTLANFYDKYIKTKTPHPAGALHEIQLKGKNGFEATPKLSYDVERKTLNIEGKTSTATLEVKEGLRCSGAIMANVKNITSETYNVEAEDYTLLCDSYKNRITVTLPPACNCAGRILIIKKVNTDKYNLRSFPLVVKVDEGTIDISDKLVLKVNYSSRTIQSDGKNWWIIGSKGS